MKSGVHVRECRAERGPLLPEIGGGHWGTGQHHSIAVDDGGQTIAVHMRFSQTGKAISKRFRGLEPHSRVGGFRKFGGQEFEMHEEGTICNL